MKSFKINKPQSQNRQHYVPQYAERGIEPEIVNFKKAVPGSTPSNFKQPMRMQNALNIGNNQDHTWSTVDGELNDEEINVTLKNSQATDNKFEEDLDFSVTNLSVKECVLFIGDVLFSQGSKQEIQKDLGLLVLGKHKGWDGDIPDLEDITILEKLAIKAGVFID